MSDYAKQPRRKYCQFCKDEVQYVDYKDTQMLRKYVTDRGKIKPRRVTGACTQHQRRLVSDLATRLALGVPIHAAVLFDDLRVHELFVLLVHPSHRCV